MVSFAILSNVYEELKEQTSMLVPSWCYRSKYSNNYHRSIINMNSNFYGSEKLFTSLNL